MNIIEIRIAILVALIVASIVIVIVESVSIALVILVRRSRRVLVASAVLGGIAGVSFVGTIRALVVRTIIRAIEIGLHVGYVASRFTQRTTVRVTTTLMPQTTTVRIVPSHFLKVKK